MFSLKDTSCYIVATLVIQLLAWGVDSLGCFVCTSINHSDPDCEDTFNNTNKFWQGDCWASRKNRVGLFPGTQCIKMVANDDTRSIVVRNCVVDNGGTNSETEIGRQSHCGWMRVVKYNGRRMTGCILACDTEGCNHGNRVRAVAWRTLGLVLLTALLHATVMA